MARNPLPTSSNRGINSQRQAMADKSAYMSAGGYSSGYMGTNASSSGYAREEYAGNTGNASGSGGQQNHNSNGGNNAPQVFKARTDQSCYLGP